MRKRIAIIILAMMFIIPVGISQTKTVSEAKASVTSVRNKYEKLKCGFTLNKVKSILGEPKKIIKSGLYNTDSFFVDYRWKFNTKGGYVRIDVRFVDDKESSKTYYEWELQNI